MMPREAWRPVFGSPEFGTYLKAVIESSKSRREAARKLGYKDLKTVTYHMKKMGIDRPPEWDRRPWVSPARWKWLPEVIIQDVIQRKWVAGLTQGEGCIQSRYRSEVDATFLQLDVSMADSGPIFRLSDFVGLPQPSKPIKNHDWKPNWHKNISGLRALRVLQEILPFLLGEKRREADKAVLFFSPFGNHRGRVANRDIWPPNEFPSRTKRRGSQGRIR